MLTKFWETIGEDLAHEWSAKSLTASFIFWMAGALALVMHVGLPTFIKLITVNEINAILYIIFAFFVLTVSNLFVSQSVVGVIMLFEGYWPWPFHSLRMILTDKLNNYVSKKEIIWNALAEKYKKGLLSPLEEEKYAEIESELECYPIQEELRLPTVLGNILRSAEEYPSTFYGLDISVSWPRLWLLIPTDIKNEIGSVRKELDFNTTLLIWSVLLSTWSVWNKWFIAIALICSFISVHLIIRSARKYSLLIKVSYDTYRFVLYSALCLPMPDDPSKEKESGANVTHFLLRHSSNPTIKFHLYK